MGSEQGSAVGTEQGSAMGTEQALRWGQSRAVPSGSVPWGQSRAVSWRHSKAVPSGSVLWGQSRQCHCHMLRGRTHSRGLPPTGPHPAGAHAWDPAGDLSVRAGRWRSWGGGVSQRRCGREGGSGWIDGLGRGAEGVGVGDRREGNASWVELSESCSDLQPGGRCCRRERQRSPTPPGAASLFYCSRKKRCRVCLAPLPLGEETLPPLHSSAGSPPPHPITRPGSELLFLLLPPIFFRRARLAPRGVLRAPGASESRHVLPGQEEHPPHNGKRIPARSEPLPSLLC